MTYDELNEIILRGDPDEWLSQEQGLIYKGDLNLRIEMTDRDYSSNGERFSEPWTEALPAVHHATRQIFWILYGGTLVLEVDTVVIDKRTFVPLPESPDHSTMSRWNYGFGKIVEEYRTEYGGIYSLDAILSQAGITPEGTQHTGDLIDSQDRALKPLEAILVALSKDRLAWILEVNSTRSRVQDSRRNWTFQQEVETDGRGSYIEYSVN